MSLFTINRLAKFVGVSVLVGGLFHAGNSAASELKGCYSVIDGGISDASASHDQTIGTYHLQLKQVNKTKSTKTVTKIKLAGPVSGLEDEHEEGGMELEVHGSHVFGTNDRSGVLQTEEDIFVVTGVNEFNSRGIPCSVSAIEIFRFNSGTGKFSGLVSGEVTFDATTDACTDPTNQVIDHVVSGGELCFQ